MILRPYGYSQPGEGFGRYGNPGWNFRSPGYFGPAGGASPPPPGSTGVTSGGSGSNYFERTASFPTRSPMTFRCWVKRLVDRDTYSSWMSLNIDGGNQAMYAGTTVDGETASLYCGVLGGDSTNSDLADGDWHHLVTTMDAPFGKMYIDGVLIVDSAIFQAGNPDVSLTLLTTATGDWWNGGVLAPAVWERVLTGPEIIADMDALTPAITTDLWAWWLLENDTDVSDRSGNSRPLTKVGTGHGTTPGPGIPL